MNPSDTLLKQIDLAAQHQKEHGDHSGILHDIKEGVKEGVKEVIDIVKGKDHHETHSDDHSKVNETTASEDIPKDNVRQFNSDYELRKETLGASV